MTTARPGRGPAGRAFIAARLVAGLLGLALAGVSLPGFLGSGAEAATAGDGSDWGSTGLLHSDSAVTVRWDNVGNPESTEVPRDGRQSLPHTGGATYDDVPLSTQSPYFDTFGAGNGLGGLEMSVSQTTNLLNQAVTLDISGVKGGAPVGSHSPVFLQVFQCWGGIGPDGSPDPAAANPDPATCQVGAGDTAANANWSNRYSRMVTGDSLVPRGDWSGYQDTQVPDNDVPFTSISGTKSGSTLARKNEFFNTTSSNEVSRLQVGVNGTASRQFEVQTSFEAPGLGCGKREGSPSTSTCWLVVVPRIEGVLDNAGAIAPELWAQRLQVRLEFRDLVAGCPSSQVRILTAGSELLSTAASSWVPGLCAAKNIAMGYTQLGDEVARGQFLSGAASAVLTTRAAGANSVHVPLALSAPVISYSLSYQPFCQAREGGYTEEEATTTCGYESLDALVADQARAGTLVRSLHLDARLVAKLLTQSYVFSIFDRSGFKREGWMVRRPTTLADDPEFLRLNPDLKHISTANSNINAMNHFVLEALRSDGASQLWTWLLADPDARAFLNGCPDDDGMVVNPFYSTRTYVGCEADKTELAAQADLDRESTQTPSSYADLPLTYPPDGSPYPLVGWQTAPQEGGFPPFTVFDFLPRADSMPVAGRDTAIGYQPQNSNLCQTALDSGCVPAPGLWKDPKTRQPGDRLGVIAITTAATAASFQLPTAELCDSSGTQCVGADVATMTRAADKFTDLDGNGVPEPGPADYSSGAYPLTMPIYAAVSTKAPAATQNSYADMLEFLTTGGQVPGFGIGQLPPGYAPLTPSLVNLARTGIAKLRVTTAAPKPTVTPASTPTPIPTPTTTPTAEPSETPKPTKTPEPSSDTPTPTPQPTGSLPSSGGVVGGGPSSSPGPKAKPTKSPSTKDTTPVTETEFATVAAGTESWPRLTLPLGLAIALLAGFAGPLLRIRSRFRLKATPG